MNSGTVKKIFVDRRYGFIATSTGVDVFFHADGVPQFEQLHEGDEVTFDETPAQKGPRAINVQLVSAA